MFLLYILVAIAAIIALYFLKRKTQEPKMKIFINILFWLLFAFFAILIFAYVWE